MSVQQPQWFDRRLSMGNLISIVILIFGMAASWYALKQEQALQAARLEGVNSQVIQNSARIEKVENGRSDISDRLIRLEVGQSQQSDILRQVLEAVRAPNR